MALDFDGGAGRRYQADSFEPAAAAADVDCDGALPEWVAIGVQTLDPYMNRMRVARFAASLGAGLVGARARFGDFKLVNASGRQGDRDSRGSLLSFQRKAALRPVNRAGKC